MKEPKTDRSFFDAIFWGGVILWAGLLFGADRLGYLPEGASVQIWGWIFLGAGAYGLILNLMRSFMENLPNPSIWDYVGATVLLLIGIAGLTAFQMPWWLILVAVGALLIGTALTRRE
jgi:hypothetical protein